MAMASYVQPNFFGGEISKFGQGRFDKPDYRMSMNVCFNGYPNEIGSWVRRPGSRFAGVTRGGRPGRTIKFDFQQSDPFTVEFTDGFIRFRSGANLISTNDDVSVASISTANPAVVVTSAAHGWSSGNTIIFPAPAPAKLLEARQFVITVIDTTHFSIADAITGTSIDGSTLGTISAGSVRRIQELSSPYISGSWSTTRSVQAEKTSVLLNGAIQPQILVAGSDSLSSSYPVFQINPAVINDGPYLDPFTNGTQITPSALSGNVSLTVSFPVYSASQAYPKGAFVTSSSINYISLIDNNVNNTPSSSPSAWSTTSANAAINNGDGFLSTDIGRSVRLFSEPQLWNATTAYTAGVIVGYNPSGQPGAATYWTALTSTTGNIPGTDLTHWQITPANASVWTWGKITGLVNFIPGNISGVAHIGDMTQQAGLSAAFDGNLAKPESDCALSFLHTSSVKVMTINAFVGQNFTGTSSGNFAISSATIFPSSDLGLVFFSVNVPINQQVLFTSIAYLFASNTAPTAWNDGIVLGSNEFMTDVSNIFPANLNSTQGFATTAVTITSNDTSTKYKYVWVSYSVSARSTLSSWSDATLGVVLSQVEFVNAAGAGDSAVGVNVEILGPPLLYTTTVKTWRLGVYSQTTGYPTCGCYSGGRLWLGGALPNRFDASVSNGISGNSINFAPTAPDGTVTDSNAISAVLNSDSVNPIYWMEPDLQGVILGTQAGEWLVQAPTAGPITPTNIDARRVTKIGGVNVLPQRTEHTIVFVQRYSKKLMEYFADVYSGKFSAPNLADKAQHITSSGISELAYQLAVTPIIWGRCADGSLFGMTYKRDTLTTSQGPTFYAWHRHALGSGRVIESICSGPSVGGSRDSVTIVTNDITTGVRHVEMLTDEPDELSTIESFQYLDSSVAPSSVIVSSAPVDGAPYGGATLNGLWHLNGKTVQVFAGGLDCGNRGDDPQNVASVFTDFLVTNGSCFVPFGDGLSAGCGQGLFTADLVNSGASIVVGFTYNSDGQLVRPVAMAETGARNGPAFAKLRRNHRYGAQLVNAKGISVGTTFDNLQPCIFRQADGETPLAPIDMFSGIHQDTIQDDTTYDGMICWRVSRPYAANVVAIGGNIETHDQ